MKLFSDVYVLCQSNHFWNMAIDISFQCLSDQWGATENVAQHETDKTIKDKKYWGSQDKIEIHQKGEAANRLLEALLIMKKIADY